MLREHGGVPIHRNFRRNIVHITHDILILYFFGYKTEFFFLPKQSQRSRSVLQDGSIFLGLFRKGKIGIIAKFHRTDLVI